MSFQLPLDDDTHSEASYGARSMAALTQFGSSFGTMSTVSEIYPDDSASNRLFNRRLYERDVEDPSGSAGGPSVVSLDPSVEGSLYTVIGGRAFSAQSDNYALPADDEEHSRLDMQHFALCLTIDSLFPLRSLVRQALSRHEEPHIMDIGTGSGRWAVDMATAYPNAQVVGIDLVPPALLTKEKVPSNCRFEIDDANLPMEHYAEQFSFVHFRMMAEGLNDVQTFLYEIARVLRPGGLLMLGAGDGQLWDENRQPIIWKEPGLPGFSYVQYLLGHAYSAYWHRGNQSVNSRMWWTEWLEANPNYSSVHTEDVFIPLGPWKTEMNEREIFAANFMRESVARAFIAFHRLFLAVGHREEDIILWTEEAVKELRTMSVPAYFRFTFVAAVRGDTPWEQRPSDLGPLDLGTRSYVAGLDLKQSRVRRSSERA